MNRPVISRNSTAVHRSTTPPVPPLKENTMRLMRGSVMRLTVFSAALLFVVPSVGQAQESGSMALRLPGGGEVDAVFSRFDAPGSVGCALGVAHQGQLIYKMGYGYANLDWDIPMSPTTVIYVGSISKQFTAAATTIGADHCSAGSRGQARPRRRRSRISAGDAAPQVADNHTSAGSPYKWCARHIPSHARP